MSGKYDRKDSYYNKAKDAGLRSRAYFKLEDINKKHHLFKPGSKVLDLGAWPGGWLEYTAKCVGRNGLAVGIDLQAIDPIGLDQVKLICGDARDEDNIEQLEALAPDKYDVLVSDMSPKISGIKEADRMAAAGLIELALWIAGRLLKPGGSFVAKAFKSNECEEVYRAARPTFKKLHREELKSTRKTSTEYYLVGLEYKGNS